MEKRGIRTRRGDINRQVALDNQMLRQLRARICKRENSTDEVMVAANPSNPILPIPLIDMLASVLDNPEIKIQSKKIVDLKTVAKAINFMQQNNIQDMEGLQDKVKEMHNHLDEQSNALKKNKHRKKTLDEHIRNAETYHETLDTYRRYQALKPKSRAAFYENNHADIIRHGSAKQYLDGVLDKRTTIPLNKWKAISEKLDTKRNEMYSEYVQLRTGVRDAESLLRCVEIALLEKLQKRNEKDVRREL